MPPTESQLQPPLLRLLGNYGRGGNQAVRGEDIKELLFGAYEGGLIDLIHDSESLCLSSSLLTDRLPLTHRRLRQFMQSEFDLGTFGLSPGDRVGVLLPNGPELAVTLLCVISKWCAAPINPTNSSAEIRSELLSTRARAIIILAGASVNNAAIEAVKNLPIGVIVVTPTGGAAGLVRLNSLIAVAPSTSTITATTTATAPPTNMSSMPPSRNTGPGSRTVLLLHTSGTSGNKKLVPYTVDMVVVGAACIAASWNLGPRDVCLNMMPLFHIGGIMRNVIAPILAGGHMIACSGFDPLLFWDIAAARTFTWYYAAPTMHHAIVSEAASERRSGKSSPPLLVQSIRFVANAAGGLLPALAQSLKATFVNAVVLTSYGMTECMPISTPPQSYQLDPTGTSGLACGPDVLICDESNLPCSPGVVGNIFVRGGPCFAGYEQPGTVSDGGACCLDSEANATSFVTINEQAGWFGTGDCGSIDANGYLFITGRSKEIINRGGETISPFEVEEACIKHPCVKEALAFSAPHEQFQETVGLVVVTKEGFQRIDLATLHRYLDDKLHRSKWPQLLVYMDALPKNATGKLLRINLAKRLGIGSIDEDTRPLGRIYQAPCPPVGLPLSEPIAGLTPVLVDHTVCERFLIQEQNSYRIVHAAVVQVDLPFHPDAFVAFVVLNKGNATALAKAQAQAAAHGTDSNQTAAALAAAHRAREEALLASCIRALPGYAAPCMLQILDALPVITLASVSSDSLDENSCGSIDSGSTKNTTKVGSATNSPSRELASTGTPTIDRDALTALALRLFAQTAVILPRNVVERQVEEVWRKTLSAKEPLSVLTSFFDLGGDSLKAGQLVHAIRQRLSVPISVADLFTAPTIEKLAQKITLLKIQGSPSLGTTPPEGHRHSLVSSGTRPGSDSPASRWKRFFSGGVGNTPTNSSSSSSLSGGGGSSSDANNENVAPADKSAKFFSYDHASLLSNTSIYTLAVQLLPLCVFFPIRKIVTWFLVAVPWVYLMRIGWGRFRALVASMLLSRILQGVGLPLFGIASKWVLIGRYKAGKYPLWGAMYLRWWLTEQIVNICGRGFFRDDLPIIGSHMVRLYYVLLGARIGGNVKIHKDAKIGTVADLLVVGDDVVVDNCYIRPFTVEEGHFLLLPIHIGSRCALGVKSIVAPGTSLPNGTCLPPLSSSHEIKDADPEYRKFVRQAFQQPSAAHVLCVGVPILLLVNIVAFVPWYFGLMYMVYSAKANGWYESEIHSVFHAFLWWIAPQRLFYYFLLRIIRRCVVPFIRLALVVGIKRWIIGPFVPMGERDKRKPWNRMRYWLMYRLLPGGNLGGVARLVGSHYEIISHIYRLLGSQVGANVYWPGSGLEIVEYDLLHVGNDVVFGSRSVVLTSSGKRSAVVKFEDGAMIADRCVLLPGTRLGKGSVLGSGSLAKEDFEAPVGSVWLGSSDGCAVCAAPEDRSYNLRDTTSPFGRAFYQNEASYAVYPLWFVVLYNMLWQAFCTCYRNCPTALSLMLCSFVLQFEHYQNHSAFDLFVVTLLAFIPLNLYLSFTALGIDLAGKWLLMGRRQAGSYPWDQSSYCQRWQMHLTLQEIRRGERRKTGVLDMLQGSQWLVWYFNLMGSNIGRNVCLYPNGGDPMMTEPDLVTIGDECVVDDASLIAHINTRGIFRLNPLVVGKCSVLKSMTRLLSGASTEPFAILQEHTLVLAGEVVEMGSVWQGWPSRASVPLLAYRAALRRHLGVILHQQLQTDVEEEQQDPLLYPYLAKSLGIIGAGPDSGRVLGAATSFGNLGASPSLDSGSSSGRHVPLLSTGGPFSGSWSKAPHNHGIDLGATVSFSMTAPLLSPGHTGGTDANTPDRGDRRDSRGSLDNYRSRSSSLGSGSGSGAGVVFIPASSPPTGGGLSVRSPLMRGGQNKQGYSSISLDDKV